MFKGVYFNTLEKMEKCFKTLTTDTNRKAHTFYWIAPESWAKQTKYYVYYLPKR